MRHACGRLIVDCLGPFRRGVLETIERVTTITLNQWPARRRDKNTDFHVAAAAAGLALFVSGNKFDTLNQPRAGYSSAAFARDAQMRRRTVMARRSVWELALASGVAGNGFASGGVNHSLLLLLVKISVRASEHPVWPTPDPRPKGRDLTFIACYTRRLESAPLPSPMALFALASSCDCVSATLTERRRAPIWLTTTVLVVRVQLD